MLKREFHTKEAYEEERPSVLLGHISPKSAALMLANNSVVLEPARGAITPDNSKEPEQDNLNEKPVYTYAAMVVQALCNSATCKLTMVDIQHFIQETYPSVTSSGWWKNSLRRSLCQNSYFWSIATDDEKQPLWTFDARTVCKFVEFGVISLELGRHAIAVLDPANEPCDYKFNKAMFGTIQRFVKGRARNTSRPSSPIVSKEVETVKDSSQVKFGFFSPQLAHTTAEIALNQFHHSFNDVCFYDDTACDEDILELRPLNTSSIAEFMKHQPDKEVPTLFSGMLDADDTLFA